MVGQPITESTILGVPQRWACREIPGVNALLTAHRDIRCDRQDHQGGVEVILRLGTAGLYFAVPPVGGALPPGCGQCRLETIRESDSSRTNSIIQHDMTTAPVLAVPSDACHAWVEAWGNPESIYRLAPNLPTIRCYDAAFSPSGGIFDRLTNPNGGISFYGAVEGGGPNETLGRYWDNSGSCNFTLVYTRCVASQ